VWNGCWCTWFHPACAEKGESPEGNRAYKERLVREGKAHAALVFDGGVAVAWCEYGSPDELPNIYHLKEYNAGLDKSPDYRLTCFFVDRDYRRKGVAALALRGALDLICPGGRWFGRSVSTGHAGQKDFGLFPLQRYAQSLEKVGFSYERSKGKNHCVMRKMVSPS
jgi:GNAT superfamily N-acetyltransferase